jgi:hypothetical protein
MGIGFWLYEGGQTAMMLLIVLALILHMREGHRQ